MNILVVEDEVDLLETIEQFLRDEGLTPMCCHSLREAEQYLESVRVDVLILDLTLGTEDALVWLDQMELPQSVYVIITSARVGSDHRIAGFARGADVYLEKPVNLYELLAVIQRIKARLNPSSAPRWLFSAISRRLIAPNGLEVRLTGMQQLLVESFVRAENHACSHETLVTALGHEVSYYTPQRLDTALRRLRQSVEKQCGLQLPVENRYGWGYVFTGALQMGE